ncbi:uncharacterized protein LOC144334236 [Macaca mulatta]
MKHTPKEVKSLRLRDWGAETCRAGGSRGSHLLPQGLAMMLAAHKAGACGDTMPLNRLRLPAACGLHSFMHKSSETGASFSSPSPDFSVLNKNSSRHKISTQETFGEMKY